ncbi:type 2 periplasmic-binding domain-containing protein [Brochothrix campestris]|uniref:Transcriptional regulator, LysR family protein n=1 Tax=Brochothrix campestris FSL F6-1037 TaxID=1265861 RepID=W7C6Q7_9LIST|nr:hypothetical protein [Brochothrix campestris]EUJ35194.1 transcriptional regulator, LysR family protein [Brochothrix campestris FSL F6-1037]
MIGLIEKPTNRLDLKELVIIKDEMIHVGQTNSPYWLMREKNSGVRYYQDLYLDKNEISANKIVTNNLSFIFKLLKSNIGQTIVSKKALAYLPQLDWQPTNLWRNLIMIQKKMHVENSLNEEIAAFLAAEFKAAEIRRQIAMEKIESS